MNQSEANVSTSVFDKCVILNLTVHVIGQSVQGDKGEIVTSADKRMCKLYKLLFEKCEEYKTLVSMGSKIR